MSIPEAPKERGPRDPPEFVRFYMGEYIRYLLLLLAGVVY